jgi:hypothetical protein
VRKKGFRGWIDGRDTLRREGGGVRQIIAVAGFGKEEERDEEGEREGEEKWREGGSPRRCGVRVRDQGKVNIGGKSEGRVGGGVLDV